MKKPIDRKTHGFAEWTYIPLTALSPELLKFDDHSTASGLARAASGLMLASALFTRAEWGLVKLLPFKAHLAGDVAIGAFSLLAPWIFKFSKNRAAKNAFLFIGLSSIIIGGLLTQGNEMER